MPDGGMPVGGMPVGDEAIDSEPGGVMLLTFSPRFYKPAKKWLFTRAPDYNEEYNGKQTRIFMNLKKDVQNHLRKLQHLRAMNDMQASSEANKKKSNRQHDVGM